MKSYQIYSIISVVVLGLLILTSCSVGYKNDGNEVTWHTWNEGNGHNSRKVDADPETFEVLDDDYGRDKTHAFYRGDIIKGADGLSFRVLEKGYAADASNVYDSGKYLESAPKGSVFESTVRVYELLGAEVYLYFDLDEFPITARVDSRTTARPGDNIKFAFDLEKIHVFDKETETIITN